MVTEEDAVEIERLHRQGLGVRDVARRGGVSRNAERRVRDAGSERRYVRAAHGSTLGAYVDCIAARLAAALGC